MSSSRALLIGNSPVGATEDQHLHQLLEDHFVGDARPVATERMVHFSLGQQGAKLLPNGLDNVWLDSGHGINAPSHYREASDTPRMIEHPVAALQLNTPRPYWRGL